MISLTAVLRVKAGEEEKVKAALARVVEHVRSSEPDTIAYFAAQDARDPRVFTTYERYADMAALERHNGSGAVAEFFAVAQPALDGEPVIVISNEFAVK